MTKVIKLGSVVIAALLLALALNLGSGTSAVSAVSSPAQTSEPTTSLYTQIYQEASPSVVAIHVTIAGRNGRTMGSGTGSGFVIDDAGHIVTNNHVVSGATSIEVEFLDGTLAAAEVVGLDPDSDLAVLVVQVPAAELTPVTFGNSDALLVGEPVLAIGSPFGQDWTLTTGVVSGLNRVISGLTDFSIGGVIQTDAAINPGNSGGPLLNLAGQVVGVNSQILSDSGSNAGVGFAIPGNLVARVAQELITDGSVDYSYIGLSGSDMTLDLIQALNLPGNTRGVVVANTVPGGPADKAGLQSAVISSRNIASTTFDLITAIDGTPIVGMDDLISFLARETTPGDTVTLTVLRNGSQTISLPVTLAARPGSR